MQISLTKKLADILALKPEAADVNYDPLYSWTANYIQTWSNRKENTLIVMNNATCFCVGAYSVKRTQLNKPEKLNKLILDAIRHTMERYGFNPELIQAYFEKAEDITYTKNTDRQITARLSSKSIGLSNIICRRYEYQPENIYDDAITIGLNEITLFPKNGEVIQPDNDFMKLLEKEFNLPLFKNDAYVIDVTLDLKAYKATRRIIVQKTITLEDLHLVLQEIYDWENRHLFTYEVYKKNRSEPEMTYVDDISIEEYPESPDLKSFSGVRLCDVIDSEHHLVYTYDMGDSWEHEIRLVKGIKDCDKQLPYQLSAAGSAPPEDIGGVYRFLEILDRYNNGDSDERIEIYKEYEFYSPELSEYYTRPRTIII